MAHLATNASAATTPVAYAKADTGTVLIIERTALFALQLRNEATGRHSFTTWRTIALKIGQGQLTPLFTL